MLIISKQAKDVQAPPIIKILKLDAYNLMVLRNRETHIQSQDSMSVKQIVLHVIKMVHASNLFRNTHQSYKAKIYLPYQWKVYEMKTHSLPLFFPQLITDTCIIHFTPKKYLVNGPFFFHVIQRMSLVNALVTLKWPDNGHRAMSELKNILMQSAEKALINNKYLNQTNSPSGVYLFSAVQSQVS